MKKLIIICISLHLSACSSDKGSPEQKIRDLLTSMEQGLEQRSVSQIMDHISDNYRDADGRLKQELKSYSQLQILRNQNIHIFTRIKSIEVNENKATASLSLAMTSKTVDLSIEQNRLNADSYTASITLNEESGTWKITSVKWKRGWLQ